MAPRYDADAFPKHAPKRTQPPRTLQQTSSPEWLPQGWVAFELMNCRGLGSAKEFFVSPTGAKCLSEQEEAARAFDEGARLHGYARRE